MWCFAVDESYGYGTGLGFTGIRNLPKQMNGWHYYQFNYESIEGDYCASLDGPEFRSSFSLYNNYPNPTKGITTIKYFVDETDAAGESVIYCL